MEDGIGIGAGVAGLVEDGEAGRLPVRGGQGIQAAAQGEAALENIGVIEFGADGDGRGAEIRIGDDRILAAVEEFVDKRLPFVSVVGFEGQDHTSVILALSLQAGETGSRHQGENAQESASFHHFLKHITKLRIFL